ncbi:DUF3862 domain-containing protein [Apilactobacillus timberlakei]|uniref:DUF3862 domain-containing protein n=1 Tax=Apilactobacillus timberlakei TaxID=2008380 RepID=A0ABY2YW45_9LACO|nr:DUF3862 domain-containing protein [Apilactobacillus timberlakei]TPR12414.1 DUF3862 domain-containing protein [Apilactobacillus timberlakei]TPR12954.1 DUF3862 domain-containing protein [Apilactobacillus timberlakei]
MKKLVSIATISLLALTISACGNSNDKKGSNNSSSSSKVVNNSKVTMNHYQAIKLSSMMDNSGGDNEKTVKNILGKPSRVTTSETNGKKMVTYTWDKLNTSFKAKNVNVGFNDGKAMTKSYANLDLNQMKPLDQSKVKTIKSGTSYKDVISKLGTPSSESEAGSGNMAMKEAMYITSTKGDATGFTFMGGNVSQISSNKIK